MQYVIGPNDIQGDIASLILDRAAKIQSQASLAMNQRQRITNSAVVQTLNLLAEDIRTATVDRSTPPTPTAVPAMHQAAPRHAFTTDTPDELCAVCHLPLSKGNHLLVVLDRDDLTAEEYSALYDALQLTLEDHRHYFETGDMTTDYSPEDIAHKAKQLRHMGTAAGKLGGPQLAEQFAELADDIDAEDTATSAEA